MHQEVEEEAEDGAGALPAFPTNCWEGHNKGKR